MLTIASKTTITAFVLSLTLFGSNSFAAPYDVVIGGQWKEQCSGQGRYTCCKKKEKACIADEIGGNHCGLRYKQCVKKFLPGHAGSQSNAPDTSTLAPPDSSRGSILVRPKAKGGRTVVK
jgi:hypothetical protein